MVSVGRHARVPRGATAGRRERLPSIALVAAVRAANGGAAATTLTMWSDPAGAGRGRDRHANRLRQSLHRRGARRRVGAAARVLQEDDRLASLARRGRRAGPRDRAHDHRRLQPGVPLPRRERLLPVVPADLDVAAVPRVVWFRAGLRGKARDFNWHNAIGLWSAVPLFVVVLSGVVISYPWASDLVYRVAGEAPPPAPQRAPGRAAVAGRVAGGGRGAGPGGGGQARSRAARAQVSRRRRPVSTDVGARRKQVDGWSSILLRLPAPPADRWCSPSIAAKRVSRRSGGR